MVCGCEIWGLATHGRNEFGIGNLELRIKKWKRIFTIAFFNLPVELCDFTAHSLDAAALIRF